MNTTQKANLAVEARAHDASADDKADRDAFLEELLGDDPYDAMQETATLSEMRHRHAPRKMRVHY